MGKSNLLCIGHRGAMGHAPENTLASITKALELGAPWIEVDIYYVDGNLLVFHDDRLEKKTNGKGYIQDQSFEYLRSLNVKKSDQCIPTLEEVCQVIAGRAGLNVELKGVGTAKPVSDLLNKLIANGWSQEQFLVSSFNHRELQVLKQINPGIRIGVLHCCLPADDAKSAADLGAYSVNPSLEFIDKRYVDDAHRRGLKVYVYTVNHPEDIARMRELGVDGVFTNYPERVLQAAA
ncbi:MAG: glycerophosphodiester phosphodiesterase [Thiolinea sp.]